MLVVLEVYCQRDLHHLIYTVLMNKIPERSDYFKTVDGFLDYLRRNTVSVKALVESKSLQNLVEFIDLSFGKFLMVGYAVY